MRVLYDIRFYLTPSITINYCRLLRSFMQCAIDIQAHPLSMPLRQRTKNIHPPRTGKSFLQAIADFLFNPI